jgi:hypothetical protein
MAPFGAEARCAGGWPLIDQPKTPHIIFLKYYLRSD